MDTATQTMSLEPASMAFYDRYGDLTVVLERPEGTKRYTFCEFVVQVQRTQDADYATQLGIKGPAHEDGFFYFLKAEPMDYGVRPRAIWLSYEEAVMLRERLHALRKADLERD